MSGSELTLTGGTLTDPTPTGSRTTTNGLLPQVEMVQHHNHSHSHGHCSHHHPVAVSRPKVALQMPADELVQQEPSKIIQTLFFITRMGEYELLAQVMAAYQRYLLEGSPGAWKEIVRQTFQENGVLDGSFGDAKHTILHWATKRKDEPRFVHFWSEYISVYARTSDGTGMTPLHWACTEGPNLPIIRFLMEQGDKDKDQPPLVEQMDASGCTPLLIAAQYGQVEAVAYLIQKGANRNALDTNRDSALHWAAYKGDPNVLGLLLYYDLEDHQQQATAPDVYGQTPLHLAALRGHKTVCRYLLEHLASSAGRVEVRRLLQKQDKNGRTPETLAMHKKRTAVAAFLNDYARNYLEVQRAKGITREIAAFLRNLSSTHRWRVCLGIASADDDMDEAPHVPFYYTLFQIVGNIVYYFTVLVPIFSGEFGELFDYALLHMWDVCLIIIIIATWIKTWKTDPGLLVKKSGTTSLVPSSEIAYWRKLYEDTLEAYADESRHESLKSVQLCHTCHLAKPPRSKHDRYSQSCVLMFDHMCPFTGELSSLCILNKLLSLGFSLSPPRSFISGNAIGLYNYKWFYLFLLSMSLFFVNMWFLMIVYWNRKKKVSLVAALIGIYFASHILMTGGLLIYHTQLVLVNLTTNEHINVRRYDHFWTKDSQGQRKYRNPWFQGYWNNVLDRFFPTQASYRLPDQQDSLLARGQDKIDRIV